MTVVTKKENATTKKHVNIKILYTSLGLSGRAV